MSSKKQRRISLVTKMREFLRITDEDINKISLLLQKELIGNAEIKTDRKYIYIRFSNKRYKGGTLKPAKPNRVGGAVHESG